MSRLYLFYGFAVLAALAYAEYNGWSMTTVSETRDTTPHTVRDNPGVYRPHYGGTGRSFGGK